MRSVRMASLLCVVAATGCGDDTAVVNSDAGIDAVADLAVDGPVEAYCAPLLPDGGFTARDGCPVALPPAKDLLDEALAKLKLDRCTVIYSAADKSLFPATLWNDPYRMPFFDAVHGAALNAPPFARTLVQQLDAAVVHTRPVTAGLMVAMHYAGHGGQVCLPAPRAVGADPLADALARLIQQSGGKADVAALAQQAAVLPQELQRALAPVVDALAGAALARDEALNGVDLGPPPGIDFETLFTYAASLTIRSKSGKTMAPSQEWVRHLLEGKEQGFRYGLLYQAAVRLAAAVEGADLGHFAGLKLAGELNVLTPVGRVVVRGAGDDAYDPADAKLGPAIALLLDTGGKDTYRVNAGATASAANPVSVLIDLSGADSYGYTEVPSPYDGKRLVSDADGRSPGVDPSLGNGPVSLSEVSRQGAGRLGIGLLFDLGAEGDSYTSLRMSQGFGALGVGVLHDAGGNDTYRGENGVQGAAVFGIGLLLDDGGDDSYETYHQSQGFAYAGGVGLLYDRSGSDSYLADPGDPDQGGDPLYYTPQLSGKGNSSFTQGAGLGRRADTTDKIYMSGGLGVIRDLEGNDTYQASVFAQGTGYWFGTGILADGKGDDHYDGLWYVQGSDAHFALAVLWDDGGNDRYNSKLVPKATSVGVGHDYSVGWLLDLGGDDTYRAPGLSLGSGNDNGMGFLVDVGGSDSYDTKGKRTLGGASLGSTGAAGPRASVITLGVFIDTQGQDSYVVDGNPDPRDDSSWLYQSTNTQQTSEWGVGLDSPGGQATLP